LIFTPVFYVVSRWLAALAARVKSGRAAQSQPAE